MEFGDGDVMLLGVSQKAWNVTWELGPRTANACIGECGGFEFSCLAVELQRGEWFGMDQGYYRPMGSQSLR